MVEFDGEEYPISNIVMSKFYNKNFHIKSVVKFENDYYKPEDIVDCKVLNTKSLRKDSTEIEGIGFVPNKALEKVDVDSFSAVINLLRDYKSLDEEEYIVFTM